MCTFGCHLKSRNRLDKSYLSFLNAKLGLVECVVHYCAVAPLLLARSVNVLERRHLAAILFLMGPSNAL